MPTRNHSRVAFEADLPRIEAADFGGNYDRNTGANCVNPPPGADFDPTHQRLRRMLSNNLCRRS